MPQINKGGKFIFGRSQVRKDGTVRFPPQAVREYDIASEGKVYLFTGSKSTGGFCVTRRGLLLPSRIGHILSDLPALDSYAGREGVFYRYKGRYYCWVAIGADGSIRLTDETLQFFQIGEGMELLSVRSSNIAFTMGAKGPLLEKADGYIGDIPVY